MRPHPNNTSEATGIKRSNFHFDDQTGSLHAVMQTHTEPMPPQHTYGSYAGSLHAVMQTHTEPMPPQHTYGSYASLKPAATNENAIAVHNHENAFSFNETISHFIGDIALGILSSIALGILLRCIYLSTRVDSAWYGTPIYVAPIPVLFRLAPFTSWSPSFLSSPLPTPQTPAPLVETANRYLSSMGSARLFLLGS